jgi:hypothetical protein
MINQDFFMIFLMVFRNIFRPTHMSNARSIGSAVAGTWGLPASASQPAPRSNGMHPARFLRGLRSRESWQKRWEMEISAHQKLGSVKWKFQLQ